jgi:hypothetical protein
LPTNTYIEGQTSVIELRPDKKINASNFMNNNTPYPAPITRTVSTTVEWGIEISVGVTFEQMNAALKGSYKKSLTVGNTYSASVEPGRIARIIYVPQFEHVTGVITVVTGGDTFPNSTGQSVPGKVITAVDHQPFDILFPLDGGYFQLEYQDDGLPLPPECEMISGDPGSGNEGEGESEDEQR